MLHITFVQSVVYFDQLLGAQHTRISYHDKEGNQRVVSGCSFGNPSTQRNGVRYKRVFHGMTMRKTICRYERLEF